MKRKKTKKRDEQNILFLDGRKEAALYISRHDTNNTILELFKDPFFGSKKRSYFMTILFITIS